MFPGTISGQVSPGNVFFFYSISIFFLLSCAQAQKQATLCSVNIVKDVKLMSRGIMFLVNDTIQLALDDSAIFSKSLLLHLINIFYI